MKTIKINNPNDILNSFSGIIQYPDGIKEWYFKGKLHRLDGPAVEHAVGSVEYYKNGKRHRIDGPAIEHTEGTKLWYSEGNLHRIDGPAIEYADGSIEYWFNGKETTKKAIELLNNILKLKELSSQ
jgi:hypothetical protein